MKRAVPITVSRTTLRNWPIPEPTEGSGKEGRGRVLVIGGTQTVPGAVRLAGEAALRAGAGKLQVGAPAGAATSLAVAMPEAKVVGIRTNASGNLMGLSKALIEDLAEADSVLIGPGMDDSPAAIQLAKKVLASAHGPCVVDAGALEALPKGALKRGRVVATPHWGEMASLVGVTLEAIAANPAQACADFAVRHRVVLVLKSATTYIGSPDGCLWRHTGGSVGLGTSGSGDVLAGLIAGLLARGASPEQAAVWGVCVHGIAGTQLSRTVGCVGFLARELAPLFPSILGKLGSVR